MTRVHFAQISDIHLSTRGDMHDMMTGHSADFLANIVADLNQRTALDFVLISGDLFNEATLAEFDLFQDIITALQKPYYIIPGNHDRKEANSSEGLTHLEFARQFNPQLQARLAAAEPQPGYWSIGLQPGIQLIGLDSIKDDDWGGVIGPGQLAWLKGELDLHPDKLEILAIHHPLHELSPLDRQPGWSRFVCDNGREMLALLDHKPQVKLVLTGHHHLAKADVIGHRLHLACPAVVGYPCAYRTLRLNQQPTGQWQVEWQTHPVTIEATVTKARRRMTQAWLGVGFEQAFVEAYVGAAAGDVRDRVGQMMV